MAAMITCFAREISHEGFKSTKWMKWKIVMNWFDWSACLSVMADWTCRPTSDTAVSTAAAVHERDTQTDQILVYFHPKINK